MSFPAILWLQLQAEFHHKISFTSFHISLSQLWRGAFGKFAATVAAASLPPLPTSLPASLPFPLISHQKSSDDADRIQVGSQVSFFAEGWKREREAKPTGGAPLRHMQTLSGYSKTQKRQNVVVSSPLSLISSDFYLVSWQFNHQLFYCLYFFLSSCTQMYVCMCFTSKTFIVKNCKLFPAPWVCAVCVCVSTFPYAWRWVTTETSVLPLLCNTTTQQHNATGSYGFATTWASEC